MGSSSLIPVRKVPLPVKLSSPSLVLPDGDLFGRVEGTNRLSHLAYHDGDRLSVISSSSSILLLPPRFTLSEQHELPSCPVALALEGEDSGVPGHELWVADETSLNLISLMEPKKRVEVKGPFNLSGCGVAFDPFGRFGPPSPPSFGLFHAHPAVAGGDLKGNLHIRSINESSSHKQPTLLPSGVRCVAWGKEVRPRFPSSPAYFLISSARRWNLLRGPSSHSLAIGRINEAHHRAPGFTWGNRHGALLVA